jgi:hypothetical protein
MTATALTAVQEFNGISPSAGAVRQIQSIAAPSLVVRDYRPGQVDARRGKRGPWEGPAEEATSDAASATGA